MTVDEIALKIKQRCQKNLHGFYQEIDPTQTCDLFVKLAEAISLNETDADNALYYKGITQQVLLLNAALHRTTDECKIQEFENKIRSLCGQILSNATSEAVTQNHDIIKTTKSIKHQLNLMREHDTLEYLKKIPTVNPQKNQQKFSKQVHQEQEKIDILDDIMRKITTGYTKLMKNISDQCIEMLGALPCNFAHVAMGSLSRGVATYYSDFENAIVFEDTASEEEMKARKCYFRSYAALFEIIVTGFGETPVRLAGIQSLNNFTSKNKDADWFWDSVTQSGMRFDSQMPFASKTPFARSSTHNKTREVELVGTKSHILSHLKEDCVLKEGYHLAEMLSSTSFIAGNVNFFEEFSKDANQVMETTFKSSKSLKALLDEYQQNIVNFSVHTEIEKYGSKLDVKKAFYKTFSVFSFYLERLTGVNDSLSFRTTVERWKKNGMDANVAHNLLYALCLANEARLKLYSNKMEQSDTVAGTKYLLDSSSGTGVFDVLDKCDVVTSFEIGLQWNKALVQINDQIRENNVDLDTEKCVIACLNQYLQSRNNPYTQGLILQHFQEYEEAVESYQHVLDTSQDNIIKLNAYKNIGRCLMFSLNFRKATDNYTKAISWFKSQSCDRFHQHDLAELLDWLGQSYAEFDHGLAEKYLTKSRDLWRSLQSSEPENTIYLKGLADVNDSFGWFYYKTKEFGKSLEAYEEAAMMFEKLKAKSSNPDLENLILNVQNGIGLCYERRNRYNEAILQLKKVNEARKRLSGEEAAVLHISFTKRKIANCYMELGNFKAAIEEYEEALRIRQASVEKEREKKASIGFIKGKMAECYFRMGDLENAIKIAEMSFSLGHEISDNSSVYPEIMQSAIEVTVKISEKICKKLGDASFRDEFSSLQSTVKKMLQVLEDSFYENKLDEEKVQLRKINKQLNEEALPQDKNQ